jgi:hypothetical protein
MATVAAYVLWAAHWVYSVWLDERLAENLKAEPDE